MKTKLVKNVLYFALILTFVEVCTCFAKDHADLLEENKASDIASLADRDLQFQSVAEIWAFFYDEDAVKCVSSVLVDMMECIKKQLCQLSMWKFYTAEDIKKQIQGCENSQAASQLSELNNCIKAIWTFLPCGIVEAISFATFCVINVCK